MPRTSIPVANLASRGGIVIGSTSGAEVNGDTGNGHSISGNDGRVLLHARNSASGTITITLHPGIASVDGFTLPDRTISRAGVGDLLIGPFPLSMFGETVNLEVSSANWRLRAYKLIGTPSRAATPPAGITASARTVIPLTTITRSGVDITAGLGSEVTGDTVNNHYFPNDGNAIILARATSVDTSYNPVAAVTMDGQAIPDFVAIVQAASPVELAGPYPPNIYNQAEGNVYMNVVSNTIRLRGLWLPYQE